jgi:hypothetical protein
MDQRSFNVGGFVLHILYIFLPIVLGAITLAVKKHIKSTSAKVEVFFMYYLIIAVGVQALLTGCLQIFVAERIANYAKWPFSPFLTEVGLANLAFGILGIMCIWVKGSWREAAAIGYSIFLIGAGINHIVNIMTTGNMGPGNYGPTLWSDILVPVALWILLALRHSSRKTAR